MTMKVEVTPPGVGRNAGERNTYTTTERDELAAKSRSKRLSEYEAEDLRYVWAGVSADMGVRSPHASLEARLLMAPPRDVEAPILEELARLGDWVCEGFLLRLVTMETSTSVPRGVPGELRRALQQLVRSGRVERRDWPLPDVPPRAERSNRDQQRIEDYTGFEVRRAVVTAARLVPMTREERWAAEDADLERAWQTIPCKESQHATGDYEPPENVQMRRVDRARKTLARLNELDRKVLAAVYGEHRATETAEVEAVRFLVGGDEEKARAAIDAACTHYRDARLAMKAERFAAILRGAL